MSRQACCCAPSSRQRLALQQWARRSTASAAHVQGSCAVGVRALCRPQSVGRRLLVQAGAIAVGLRHIQTKREREREQAAVALQLTSWCVCVCVNVCVEQDKRLVVLQEKAAKGNAVAQNEVLDCCCSALCFFLIFPMCVSNTCVQPVWMDGFMHGWMYAYTFECACACECVCACVPALSDELGGLIVSETGLGILRVHRATSCYIYYACLTRYVWLCCIPPACTVIWERRLTNLSCTGAGRVELVEYKNRIATIDMFVA